MARPRRRGPTRSIFMLTVVDHVSPWFTPRSTLANTTHDQLGAQMIRRGTGSPAAHPPSRTGLRPNRSASDPATALVTALVAPNATRKVMVDVKVLSPKTSLAMSGSSVRSWPTMPPTRAFTPTSRANCGRLARSPSRGALGLGGSVLGLALLGDLRATAVPSDTRPPSTPRSRPAG